jgi:nucleotide-binding universal stress UspA family protein
MLRSLLIALDLTPGSDRVLGRTALLPLAEDVRITLLHVVPRTLPSLARERAERDARKALTAETQVLERSVPKGAVLHSVVRVGAAPARIAQEARALKAELIVMGRGKGRTLRDLFIGSTAERVMRQGKRPVLLVRLPPRGAYRRPALALDLDRAAPEVISLLLKVMPPPRPRTTVIHAYDAPYQGMIYPSLSVDEAEEHREHYQKSALRKLERLLSTAIANAAVPAAEAPTFKPLVRNGSPRLVIEKAVRKADADLLVLGTHGHAGIAHAFLGTVAGDVLREVSCDVLVVPPRGKA